jgi:hypothetical protein
MDVIKRMVQKFDTIVVFRRELGKDVLTLRYDILPLSQMGPAARPILPDPVGI